MRAPTRILVDTIIPSGAHPTLNTGIVESGFGDFLQQFHKTAVPSMRIGWYAAVSLAIWVSPLLIGRPPPLFLYGRATRERALLAMENSRIKVLREMMALLKTTMCFHYGAVPEVRVAIGHPRPDGEPPGRATEAQLPPPPRLAVLNSPESPGDPQ